MRISGYSKYIEVEETGSLVCEPPLDLLSNEDESTELAGLSILEKKKKLGQVFTPNILAEFMVSIIKKNLKPEHSILDPCIGPNTFLSQFVNLPFYPTMVGIEVDNSLVTSEIQAFFNAKNGRLVLDNFLTYSLSNKFDFVIQNPPYVRQELLTRGVNTKEIASESIGGRLSKQIPSQSNLYVYFLIKAILHLKDNGVMVAVIYDSWLYSSFGKALKNILLELGSVNNIYHFKTDAFPDAEVGATVIEFCKTVKPTKNNKLINYYVVDSIQSIASLHEFNSLSPLQIAESEFSSFNFNEGSCLAFENDFFITLKNLSNKKIQRGISSIANGHFLHAAKRFKESIPIIKDISRVASFSSDTHTAYLLSANGKVSKETMTYLEKVKAQIVEAGDKYKAVRERILKGENWFKINLKNPGNFIFNYYLRNNVDFILNEKQFYASDNFYILNIPEEVNAYLAILNSSFTRISVLRKSRSQGSGLRKIQLYEFNDIPVVKISSLSKNGIAKLSLLGSELKEQNRYKCEKNKVINKIDRILLSEYNRIAAYKISLEDVEAELKKYIS